MAAQYIRLYGENPNPGHIRQVVDVLEQGGIVIYPTDSVYAIGCSVDSKKAMEKIADHKGFDPKRPDMSLIFHDLSQLAEYYGIIISSSLSKGTLPVLLHSFCRPTTRYQSFSKTGKEQLEYGYHPVI
jgi:tRNA A37 threonylcarbamoyladenosine synthetase subunit TsaC/SUA5/YrdC